MKQNTNNLEELLNDNTLTKEQKIEALSHYSKSVDKELNQYIAKQWLNLGVEVAAAALPVGAGAFFKTKQGISFLEKTVGAELAKKISENGLGALIQKESMTKSIGNKLSSAIDNGVLYGTTSGALFGAIEGALNDKNVLKSAVEGAGAGLLLDGLGMGAYGYMKKLKNAKQLENLDINKLSPEQIQEIRALGKNYYKDYLQGREIFSEKLGDIRFPRSQAGEIGLHNYKMVPKLPEQIRGAKNVQYSNDKPHRLDADNFYKLYNDHNGKNYEYVIRKNSNNTGHDFYQIKEVGSNPAYSHQNRALELEPNNIMNDISSDVNPAQVAIPGIIFQSSPLDSMQTEKAGSNPAYLDQPQALELEPINIMNDVSTNVNPAQVAISDIIFQNYPFDSMQTKEAGSNPAYSDQNRALELEPNNIMNDISSDVNPAQVAIPTEPTFSNAPINIRIEKNQWDAIPMADPLKMNNQYKTEDNQHIYTRHEIGKMSNDEFVQKHDIIMQQMQDGLIINQVPTSSYSGYVNPITNDNQIYSREDIASMSLDEYSDNEKAIMAQLNSIGIPFNMELQAAHVNGNGVVYVRPYTKSDGTQVRGYYRAK